MKKIMILCFVIFPVISCTTTVNQRKPQSPFNYLIQEISQDETYGFDPSNPVKTGFGPAGERYYLDQLAGPEGEKISYERLCSCCAFETDSPDAFMGMGMLDKYQINYKGCSEAIILYINMYDFELPKAPVNFSIK